jgi:hypothetical protein
MDVKGVGIRKRTYEVGVGVACALVDEALVTPPATKPLGQVLPPEEKVPFFCTDIHRSAKTAI